MKMNTIALVCIGDTGDEPYAIRSALEYYGYRVLYMPIGRPNDFIAILKGEALYPDVSTLIICCHGEEGKIIMPELGEDVYEPEEPRGPFDGLLIEKYGKLPGITVVSTGCTIGLLSGSFRAIGCPRMIGATGYVDGNAALLFVLTLFYFVARDQSFEDAFPKAAAVDGETQLFTLS